MRTLTTTIAFILFFGCKSTSKDTRQGYPKQIDNRLYTTDSTFYMMNESDTLTKLLNEKLEIVYPQRIGNRLYTTDSTFHVMSEKDTLTKLLHEKTFKPVK